MEQFYSELRQVETSYCKNPDELELPMSTEFDELDDTRKTLNELTLVDFTDEEGYGKYFDLNECFDLYLNLKGFEKMDYLTYLSAFDRLHEIPKEKKLSGDYKRYVQRLLEYLFDFTAKARPLVDLDELIEQELRSEFERQWNAGQVAGWPKETSSALAHSGAKLDLTQFTCWEELASLGLDRLKYALMAINVKCGGTLEERARRLFSLKGKREHEIDASLLAKPSGKGAGLKATANRKDVEKQKELAWLETQVIKLVEVLDEVRRATAENVQRKQARTAGEREESDEEVSGNDSDDETDDEVVYNPKNLPLGWDGKPIPYWLYKLHGLNISFTCEICGNATYKGPKAFQMHFAEWRHAHGMRCLGIPNTAHFANVTSIEDALNLWNKLKDEKQKEKFQPTNEEEYEDSEGRVVNKKTYEDLKRQGLL